MVTIIISVLIGVLFPTKSGEVNSSDNSLRSKFISNLSSLEDRFVTYDPSYRQIDYPCGDVPSNVGVCSDVVVRAFLKVDICLQEEVYKYRKSKGLPTDTNIDHRRVRNLCPYFKSLGWEIPVTNDSSNEDYYQPGDILWWKLPGEIDHIGIVTEDYKVLHNFGFGQGADSWPFVFEIHKAYRINV